MKNNWSKPYWFFSIQKKDIIVDLGASNGCVSIEYLKVLGDNGLIIAVEPAKASFEMLRKNTKKHLNVKILRAAISNKNGKEKLWAFTPHQKNPIYANSTTFKRKGYDHVEVVDALTWNSLIDKFKLKTVDLCKVDVEGAEVKLLEGMTKVYPNKIIIECHKSNDLKWWSYSEVKKLLKEKGYDIIAEVGSFPYIYGRRKQ